MTDKQLYHLLTISYAEKNTSLPGKEVLYLRVVIQ